MSLWTLLGWVAGSGALGGLINAFISDNGLRIPGLEKVNGSKIIRLGFIGNCVIGAVAAALSWGLYGPFADMYIIGGSSSQDVTSQKLGLTILALLSAVLVGFSGVRWITNEAEKKFLRLSGSEAANKPSNPNLARSFLTAKPFQIYKMVTLVPNINQQINNQQGKNG